LPHIDFLLELWYLVQRASRHSTDGWIIDRHLSLDLLLNSF